MRIGSSGGGAPTVLALRALGLGDLLTGLPALRALRNQFPQHELVLAAPERFQDVVHLLGCVDRLLPVGADARVVPSELLWEGAPPDVAVNLHGRGPQSRELLQSRNPGRLLSYGPDGPAWEDDEHERVRWCRLLTWYGIPADPDDLLLPTARDDRRTEFSGPIVLHPGADAAARRWPVERFARLAEELAGQGHEVVITAGHGEGRLARHIALLAGLDESVVRGGEADIPFEALVQLVSEARALVSGDTGVAHLAVSLATPSVTLFGPMSPALWGPPQKSRHAAIWRPDPGDGPRPGDAHADVPDPRLLRISVEEVLGALADVAPVGASQVQR
ncbi:MAG: glycosyltransferase family 9 protein [Catenulispora sp.]|nr:glycosyltransferase family 9 protein [Catenulispora sp.]